MINWQRTNELVEEVGPESFNEVFGLFIEEVEDELEKLTTKDIEILRQQMHFLKGSALNLGFRSMANLCQSTEVDINIESIAADRIAQVRTIFDQSINSFLTEKEEKLKIYKI